MITFLIINCISQFFLVIPNTVVWAFISDIVDYSQWKTGVRSEGIIYSSYSFARKVSQALAGFIPGLAFNDYRLSTECTANSRYNTWFENTLFHRARRCSIISTHHIWTVLYAYR